MSFEPEPYIHPKLRDRNPGAVEEGEEKTTGVPREGFDPSQKGYREVIEFMDAHPDLASAVKAAESMGQKRVSILNHVVKSS